MPPRDARSFDLKWCRKCWNVQRDPKRHQPITKKKGRRIETNDLRGKPPCKHLGAETGETMKCSSCPGSVKLKLFSCDVYGKCFVGHSNQEVRGCEGCPKYERAGIVPEAGGVRHLLFHLMPVRGNDVWKWNLDQLTKRWPLFNGKKVCVLVKDESCERPEIVGDVLRAMQWDEILEVDNDSRLREVKTFLPLFSSLCHNLGKDETFFYCHAKGVTKPENKSVRRWTEIMYSVSLDHFPRVQEQLQHHPIAVPFKKVGAGWSKKDSSSDWHSSGSFFWCRNRDLFARQNWRRVDPFNCGIESYPSVHFSKEEAAAIFLEGTVPEMDLYSEDYWRNTVDPALASWYSGETKKLLPARPIIQDPFTTQGTCIGQFWERLRAMSSPRVLECGTRGWNGRPPKHCKKHILETNPSAQWTGTDVEAGEDVDVVADLHSISNHFPPKHFDAIFCASVFEHLRRPWIAARDMVAILRPGGLLFLQSHQSFPLHGYPHDYFRFSREAIAELFCEELGWHVIASEYGFPCKIIPSSNDVKTLDWNFEAESYLNVEALIKRL